MFRKETKIRRLLLLCHCGFPEIGVVGGHAEGKGEEMKTQRKTPGAGGENESAVDWL